MPETKKEETLEPLDDSVMEPSDIYAEKGSKAVFKAYHPRARDYQWEIYDTEAGWIKAAEETVSGYVDELYRNISSMELLADQEQQIRCQITTEEDAPVTYEAKLYLLSGRISDYRALAQELGVGEPTLRDIVRELEKPGRDPRDEMPAPILRRDVRGMEDLREGMILKGTVRNVIDFGAFVDIGVHQDGLVHISRITDHYIKHPLEAVSEGDVVDVKVLDVDPVRKRISLTMRLDQEQ